MIALRRAVPDLQVRLINALFTVEYKPRVVPKATVEWMLEALRTGGCVDEEKAGLLEMEWNGLYDRSEDTGWGAKEEQHVDSIYDV